MADQEVILSRTIRGAWPVGGALGINGFGAIPPVVAGSRYLEWTVSVEGAPGHTGYLISIDKIDAAFRAWAVSTDTEPGTRESCSNLSNFFDQLGLPPVASLAVRTSPYQVMHWEPTMPDVVVLTQSFEFSASHRLALPGCTDRDNDRHFGKCSNPNGHGHNYRLDVAVASDGNAPGTVGTLESVVMAEAITRLDHKHLNLDVPEFAQLIPSVEHIAIVCRDFVEGPLLGAGLPLVSVTVWETGKTCATVRARGARRTPPLA